MSEKKVIYLKDYVKGVDGCLRDRVVVGSDIPPAQAVNLALAYCPIQVVTNGFDEYRVVRIKDDVNKFLEQPGECLIEIDEETGSQFQQKFFSHSKKDDFLLQVEQFMKPSKFRRVRSDVHLIADEMFTNFAKSALDDKTSMRFGIDSNDDTIVIHCRDSFGTLDPNIMLQNMQRCMDQGIKNAIRKDADVGAGIGSYLIYALGAGMAITVAPGEGSLVLVWMPRKGHREDRIEMNKSLIIIESKED